MGTDFWIFQDNDYKKRIAGDPKDTVFQIILSLVIGVSAFLTFCVLRPRWPTLYNARKRQKDEAVSLPDLPKTLFGWIPALWRITEEQVLTSAGLDAFVFLVFFKMAIKYLAVTLFFALVVIKPVHDAYPVKDKNSHNETTFLPSNRHAEFTHLLETSKHPGFESGKDYLWMYLVFAYFFTGLAMYLIITASRKIIAVRQDYLGSQATVTDKTIRLSGIPNYLQSESKIKEFIEELEIGNVESVLLCRDWHDLDQAVAERGLVLRKLESAMVEYAHQLREHRHIESSPPSVTGPASPSELEDSRLLEEANTDSNADQDLRPKARIWYGRLKLKHRKVDAINHYEEKLRNLDEEITSLREQEFPPTALAFVTMDSVASCQMACQAVLDSSPFQLIAKPSPAPVDVAWQNTYLPPNHQWLRSWAITGVIVILTLLWSAVLVPVAVFIDLDRIHSFFPQLAELLKKIPLGKSLVQTQLPTLVITLLQVGVPYLYSWLAYQQGIISQGDVELSVISKNFFFVFFNLFIVFTALGTVSLSFDEFGSLPLREIANELAINLEDLRQFYVNYIVLQALGLFPLRLLEFGSVSLYPVYSVTSKTPREYEELIQPPVFSYGFYLPQTLLIFLICIVYSVLRSSWSVLLPGLGYFIIGYFVYKYQLLYAMDHQMHSTGRSWVIIVDRIIVGLVIFQITVAGQLALRSAIKRSALIVPLIFMTLWFSYMYSQSYKPLMTHIALKSIRRAEQAEEEQDMRYLTETRHRQTVDESRESGLRFINPSLIAPLEKPWISGKRPGNGRSRDVSSDRSGEA